MTEKQIMTNEEMQELVSLFGLTVDLNRWDEAGKNWARIKSLDWPEDYGNKNQCLILYKEDGREINIEELRISLIRLGESLRSREIRKILGIN